MSYSIEEIQSELQVLFKGNRYKHTLGVQYTSICLAMKYGSCHLQIRRIKQIKMYWITCTEAE